MHLPVFHSASCHKQERRARLKNLTGETAGASALSPSEQHGLGSCLWLGSGRQVAEPPPGRRARQWRSRCVTVRSTGSPEKGQRQLPRDGCRHQEGKVQEVGQCVCPAGIIGPSSFSPRASWPGPFMRAVSLSPAHHWWQRNAGERHGAVSERRVPTSRRATGRPGCLIC